MEPMPWDGQLAVQGLSQDDRLVSHKRTGAVGSTCVLPLAPSASSISVEQIWFSNTNRSISMVALVSVTAYYAIDL